MHGKARQATGGSQIATPSYPRSPSARANASRNTNAQRGCYIIVVIKTSIYGIRMTLRHALRAGVPRSRAREVGIYSEKLIKA